MGGLIYGVGVNDADYVVKITKEIGYVGGKRKRKQVWICPFYRTWRGMLERVYSKKFKVRWPTYKDCKVYQEWLIFSNFKSWMETQDWEGNQLDKDILFVGNKLYSPETCVFVSGTVNSFLLDCGAGRGEWLIGCCWNTRTSKFMAQCRNPFTGKRENLGYFNSETAAHEAWLDCKLTMAQRLADIQPDERVAEALVARYTNYTGG